MLFFLSNLNKILHQKYIKMFKHISIPCKSIKCDVFKNNFFEEILKYEIYLWEISIERNLVKMQRLGLLVKFLNFASLFCNFVKNFIKNFKLCNFSYVYFIYEYLSSVARKKLYKYKYYRYL